MTKYFIYLLTLVACSCTSKTGSQNEHISTETVSAKVAIPEVFQPDSIKKYSQLLKQLYVEVEPSVQAEEWFLPFDLADRSDMRNITVISSYGAHRSTRVKGHKHSGIDIVPASAKNALDVYAISKGVVCFINQEAPVKTVIIKHKNRNGTIIYSSYIHLKDIFAEIGQAVDENTKIGVLYTRNEALKFGGNFNHLHFEIKKRIDDYSCASWLCMDQTELNEYFQNPYTFLKVHLKSPISN